MYSLEEKSRKEGKVQSGNENGDKKRKKERKMRLLIMPRFRLIRTTDRLDTMRDLHIRVKLRRETLLHPNILYVFERCCERGRH